MDLNASQVLAVWKLIDASTGSKYAKPESMSNPRYSTVFNSTVAF